MLIAKHYDFVLTLQLNFSGRSLMYIKIVLDLGLNLVEPLRSLLTLRKIFFQ